MRNYVVFEMTVRKMGFSIKMQEEKRTEFRETRKLKRVYTMLFLGLSE